jgi:two-component system response regulator AtoC
LDNLIQRFVVLKNEDAILEELVPPPAGSGSAMGREGGDTEDKEVRSLKDVRREAVISAEAQVIRKALERTNWNRKKAADVLNISYKALLYKMKARGITSRRDKVRGKCRFLSIDLKGSDNGIRSH